MRRVVFLAVIIWYSVARSNAEEAVGWAPPTKPPTAFNPKQSVVSAPTTSNATSWRYRRHNGHWWYWLPSRRWAYWTGKEWKVYQKAEYARWRQQTWPAREAALNGAHVAVTRSVGATQRSTAARVGRRYEVGDFGYGGFGDGGYANGLAERRYEGLRYHAGRPSRVWSSPMPRFDTGFPGGIRGAGIGYGPYGGPVGRNQPGAIGNFGGANMGNPFGN